MIALFVLACFFIPLFRHFTSVRMMSLAARDSVMANSLLLTLMGKLQSVRFDALSNEHPVAQAIAGRTHVMGRVEYTVQVNIDFGKDRRIKVIDLTAEFRIPGVSKDLGKRSLRMRSFVFREFAG